MAQSKSTVPTQMWDVEISEQVVHRSYISFQIRLWHFLQRPEHEECAREEKARHQLQRWPASQWIRSPSSAQQQPDHPGAAPLIDTQETKSPKARSCPSDLAKSYFEPNLNSRVLPNHLPFTTYQWLPTWQFNSLFRCVMNLAGSKHEWHPRRAAFGVYFLRPNQVFWCKSTQCLPWNRTVLFSSSAASFVCNKM